MKTNSLKTMWREGRPALGGWCSIPSSFSAEIVASLGFDYVCVDMQHGLSDFGLLVPMLQAVAVHGPTPVVRVPFHAQGMAQRVLDAGAEAVIFPMINSREEAADAVAMCRYPPDGCRSYGPIRSRLHLGPGARHANDEVACIAMIETRSGIDKLADIVSCPGLDAVYVGPSDLSLSLGVDIGGSSPVLDQAVSEILAAGRSHHIPVGIHAPSGAAARRYLEQGFSFATVATDAVWLTSAYQRELNEANAANGS